VIKWVTLSRWPKRTQLLVPWSRSLSRSSDRLQGQQGLRNLAPDSSLVAADPLELAVIEVDRRKKHCASLNGALRRGSGEVSGWQLGETSGTSVLEEE
jgi:hypothetical protein